MALTEDARKRSDRKGRMLYTCGQCGREFLARRGLGSQAGPRAAPCGVTLDPPEPRCLMVTDFEWSWPEGEPLPDLLAIQAFYDGQEDAMERILIGAVPDDEASALREEFGLPPEWPRVANP